MKIVGKTDVGGWTGWDEDRMEEKEGKVTMRENGS